MPTTQQTEVQTLLDDLVDVQSQMAELKATEQTIKTKIEAECGDWDKSTTVKGKVLQAKLSRRENISYPDKDELETVVFALMEEGEDELFRVDYKERTAQVKKWMDKNPDHELAKKLGALRVAKLGSTSIKVEVINQ